MIDDFQVADEYLGAFRRLVRRTPVEFQTNEAFLRTLMMYLKLGGERLAGHRIEVEKAEFVTEFTLVKRQPVEESAANESVTDNEGSDAESGKDGADSSSGNSEVVDPDPD